MRIERHYTEAGKGPFEKIEFRKANSEIRNPDGKLIFRFPMSRSRRGSFLRQLIKPSIVRDGHLRGRFISTACFVSLWFQTTRQLQKLEAT